MKNKLYGSPCQSGGVKCKWIFTLIAVLCFVAAFSGKAMAASSAFPYIILSDDGKTMTFYYDEANLLSSYPEPGNIYLIDESDSRRNNWKNYATSVEIGNTLWKKAEEITKAVFTANFANFKPNSCNMWFYGCNKLTVIEHLEYLNTEKVTDMRQMFDNCSQLSSLDVSTFVTDKVTTMFAMFRDAQVLLNSTCLLGTPKM